MTMPLNAHHSSTKKAVRKSFRTAIKMREDSSASQAEPPSLERQGAIGAPVVSVLSSVLKVSLQVASCTGTPRVRKVSHFAECAGSRGLSRQWLRVFTSFFAEISGYQRLTQMVPSRRKGSGPWAIAAQQFPADEKCG